jgi:hypothetical protein
MEMSARLAEVVATATASVFAHILSFSKKYFSSQVQRLFITQAGLVLVSKESILRRSSFSSLSGECALAHKLPSQLCGARSLSHPTNTYA